MEGDKSVYVGDADSAISIHALRMEGDGDTIKVVIENA